MSTAVAITRLLGGAAQLRRWLHVDIHWLGGLRSELEASCRLARKVLGPDRYDAVRAQGAALRAEAGEIHQLALGTLPAERPAPPSGEWQQLTDAERDVAILAAAGWTNSAIAIRRGTARKTVDAQMMAILAKLAVTSRADIQAQVPPADHPRLRTESSHRPLRADPLRNGCG
ncbi:MAG: helix-turn-helix transcriptional regulator [Mycobacteriaceae bacterium]|nr:helix-turn-helix transcriptional regulator [Mycobacteriaceae bacterium]